MTEKTFENFDKLKRDVFAARLTKAITTFSPFYDESYVLSLNAAFGSGKTTFLEMWGNDLESERYKVVHINAWETDFDDEPIIPIANALMNYISGKDSESKGLKNSLSMLLGVTGYALEKTTGISAEEVEEKIESKNLKSQGRKISAAFSEKEKMYKKIKEVLQNYAESLEKRLLIILVDELDRVRPDYAVKFLEAIKHIFSVKGVCFVLAVDRKQLEASVKQLYGEIDFDNYYLRFVTQEVDLPESCTQDLTPFIQKMSEDFFSKKTASGMSFAHANQENKVSSFIKDVCQYFQLRPRQIQHLFRIYSRFMAIEEPSEDKYYLSYLLAPLFLIAVGIKEGRGESSIYHKIGRRELSPEQIADYVADLNFKEDREKEWILHRIFSWSIESRDPFNEEAAKLILIQRGVSPTPETIKESISSLAQYNDNFSQCPSIPILKTMYEKLESWEDFIK